MVVEDSEKELHVPDLLTLILMALTELDHHHHMHRDCIEEWARRLDGEAHYLRIRPMPNECRSPISHGPQFSSRTESSNKRFSSCPSTRA